MRRVKLFGAARSHPVLTGGAGLTAALAFFSMLFADRQIVINTSPSVQPGLYVRSSDAPRVGAIIDFRIPPMAREYVRVRTGNNGENWYILKPIVAGPGDRIDTTGSWMVINGRRIAPMPPPGDRAGHPLPIWHARRILGPGEFFVFSGRITNSFDSRCYGPIKRNQIESVRTPMLTW
ncbi:MAG: S26 family signal peptidase [Tepidisphaeraceae bacterium]|jgi:conjugative transfer signal peptidase TraF